FYSADKAIREKQRKDRTDTKAVTAISTDKPHETKQDDGAKPIKLSGDNKERNPFADLTGDPMTTVFTGRAYDPMTLNPMPIQTILTTRRRDAVYQALVRYQPQPVSSLELP